MAAATIATDTAFNNDSVQGVTSVDITTDNACGQQHDVIHVADGVDKPLLLTQPVHAVVEGGR
jgi:hypothetical protein